MNWISKFDFSFLNFLKLKFCRFVSKNLSRSKFVGFGLQCNIARSMCLLLFILFFLSVSVFFFFSLSLFLFIFVSVSVFLFLSPSVCSSLSKYVSLFIVCVCVLHVKLCISCCKQQKHLKVSRFNFYWFALNWYRSSFVVVIAFLPFSENCSLKVNVDYKSELVTFTVFEFKFWLLSYVIYNLRLVKMENVIW